MAAVGLCHYLGTGLPNWTLLSTPRCHWFCVFGLKMSVVPVLRTFFLTLISKASAPFQGQTGHLNSGVKIKRRKYRWSAFYSHSDPGCSVYFLRWKVQDGCLIILDCCSASSDWCLFLCPKQQLACWPFLQCFLIYAVWVWVLDSIILYEVWVQLKSCCM